MLLRISAAEGRCAPGRSADGDRYTFGGESREDGMTRRHRRTAGGGRLKVEPRRPRAWRYFLQFGSLASAASASALVRCFSPKLPVLGFSLAAVSTIVQ